MENLLLLLATSFAIRLSTSPSRDLQSKSIGRTGCSALLPGSEGFDHARTRNGDDMYYARASEGGATYGVICVRMQTPCSGAEAARLLSGYVEKLKAPFRIVHQLGLIPDEAPNQNGSTGLTDYWQDSRGRDWKVKGCANGQYLVVLYVRNIGAAAVQKQEAFLNGFRFVEPVVSAR